MFLPARATRRAATTGAVAFTGLLLAGCAGSSSAASGSAGPTTTSATARTGSGQAQSGQTGRPGQGGPPGFGGADFQKLQECLAAAGVSLPTPSGLPSGAPSGPPSGGFGSGAPSGAPGGGRLFADPKVRAALQACGIDLPTGPPPVPASTG